jgi:hypothetical protein
VVIGIVEALPVLGAPFLAANAVDSNGSGLSRVLSGIGAVLSAAPVLGEIGGILSDAGVVATEEFSFFAGNKGILGSMNKEGIVSFAIEAGEGSPVRGTEMFSKMMERFGDRVNAIQGNWTYGTNLARVNELTATGVPLQEAVGQTWTASRAAMWGFTNPTIQAAEGSAGAYTRVQVLFGK